MLPATGMAVSGGERQVVSFAETRPLPTYLFAFAAGVLGVEHVAANAERTGVRREQHRSKLTVAHTQPSVPIALLVVMTRAKRVVEAGRELQRQGGITGRRSR